MKRDDDRIVDDNSRLLIHYRGDIPRKRILFLTLGLLLCITGAILTLTIANFSHTPGIYFLKSSIGFALLGVASTCFVVSDITKYMLFEVAVDSDGLRYNKFMRLTLVKAFIPYDEIHILYGSTCSTIFAREKRISLTNLVPNYFPIMDYMQAKCNALFPYPPDPVLTSRVVSLLKLKEPNNAIGEIIVGLSVNKNVARRICNQILWQYLFNDLPSQIDQIANIVCKTIAIIGTFLIPFFLPL